MVCTSPQLVCGGSPLLEARVPLSENRDPSRFSPLHVLSPRA